MAIEWNKISSSLCSHQPVAIQKRVIQLLDRLQQDPSCVFLYIVQYGIPEVAGLRALVWSCCIRRHFDSIPLDSYWDLVAEYDRYPTERLCEDEAISDGMDHPLNPSDDSIWQQYFSSQRLLNRIQMDTIRTHPDWHLFRQRESSMNRILFLFAKRHPQLGYIQGMNEMVAPFVYVYLGDGHLFWEEKQREAEAFIAFERFFYSFVSCLYQNISCLQDRLVQADHLLKEWDPILWQHLNRYQVDWLLFGRRWLQLCLCREFELPELFKIWDVLISIPNDSLRWKWLIGFMVVMMIHCKSLLLSCSSFQQCISILQHYSTSCHMNESQVFQLIHETQQRIQRQQDHPS
ncbi:hypothetical protein GpartN1_g1449.t1 [Galdieria partita]|uniref:Rab-GAP TBC domain-containing protein n=1 Tax=Galdieria partita TaxID=83374 RepID=A0A9C7PS45_9RHOD|nr:hypothetical protein GpartN1_g1449.t1 [Galdieria partita]